MLMAIWQDSIIKYMNENNLTNSGMIDEINRAGGEINKSGFSHWMRKPPRSRPSTKNSIALENILGKDYGIKFYS